jgi:type IV pilus assembly protein PilY1
MSVTRLCGRGLTTMTAALFAAAVVLSGDSISAAPPVAPVLISQTPLTVTIPAHPQIVLALTNSQSMDGDLSGAIMTGSGALAGVVGTDLTASSSPVNYTIPGGFTPPVNPGAGGQAPYTVNSAGTLVDNSASRMNVAKAGISAILSSFMAYADFALMDYSTSSLSQYSTWLYYMSPTGSNFTFTATPSVGQYYVANPCYNANVALTDAYSESCNNLLTNFGAASGVITQPYMIIGASSDDPLINDVFYAGSTFQPPICVQGAPNPANPYSAYGLGSYETGGVVEWFSTLWGIGGYSWACAPGMQPTNAGYVPFSPQVMQVLRGFGYDATRQSATSGTVVVQMKSSGNTPTPASVSAAIAAFTPYLQPETNNTGTTEIKSVAEQAPIAGIVQGANNYFSSTNPPSTNACAPARYIVLITDGLPTKDLSGNSWPPLGTAAAAGYAVTATFNGDNSLQSTNDQALTDAIAQITAANSAGYKTYVIGLGAGVDAANNPMAYATLMAMAVAGGTGSFFPANSPTALTNDLQTILGQILAASRSNASATVNTTSLNTTSTIYQPSFNSSDLDQDWTGDLRAYPISPATGLVNTAVIDWSAQAQLDTMTAGTGWMAPGSGGSRTIATWDPVALAGTPFEWTAAGNPTTGIAATTVLGQELETNTSDPSGQDALNYLRGDAALSIAGGGVYRNRTHILADIVDSAPVYIGPPPDGLYQSSSYFSYVNANSSRAPTIYVGANDGMLHAFSATTGQELWAFIPNGVFANLIQLTNPYYNEQHHFYADGSPQAADVQFTNGSWHTVLVSGENGGGNTVFALDVTAPNFASEAQLATQGVLWEFSDPNMGLSYSTPQIAETAVGASGPNLGFTVFFGNGYNSASQTPYLYALDPHTGISLPGTPINLCAAMPTACNSSLANGLSSVTVVNNLGGIGAPATTVYAGDLQGNVWRVDIRDPNPLNWVTTLLFQATDPSGHPQPITTTPAVSLNPDFPRVGGTMVYVGTGELLGTPDLTSTQVQTMYGVYDSGSNPTPLTRANLVQQTMTSSVVAGQTLRFVSGTQIALPSQSGWFVDFTLLSGERIVTNPSLVDGALTVISTEPTAPTVAMATRPHGDSLGISPPRPLLARAHRRTHQHSRDGQQRLASFDSAHSAATRPDRVVYVGSRAQFGLGDLSSAPLQATAGGYSSLGSGAGFGSAARLWPVGLGVEPPPTLVSITVTPVNPTIYLGNTQQFTATGIYSDGSTQNLTSQVTWSSATTSVATISSGGLATGITLGSSLITATLGTISGSTTLTVVNAPPPPPPPTLISLTVTPVNPTDHPGQTKQFTATAVYSNGSTANVTASATWTSSATAVATISSSGLATSVALGGTTITATWSGLSGSTTLTVVPWPTLVSINVTPANPTIDVGQTLHFTATGVYSDGTTANLSALATWTSSAPAFATLAGNIASGVAPGVTTITATDGTISGSTTLTVVPAPIPPPPLECPGGDVSYLMEFNFAGGAFNNPVFNYNGIGAPNSSLVPANGVLLGNVYAPAPVYVGYGGGGGGGGGVEGIVPNPAGPFFQWGQLGLPQRRFAWWEIR